MNNETVTSTNQATQADPAAPAQPPKKGLWMLVTFCVLLVLLIAFNMK